MVWEFFILCTKLKPPSDICPSHRVNVSVLPNINVQTLDDFSTDAASCDVYVRGYKRTPHYIGPLQDPSSQRLTVTIYEGFFNPARVGAGGDFIVLQCG